MSAPRENGTPDAGGMRPWLPGRRQGGIALLFLLFIVAPLLNQLFHFVRPLELDEKRKLAERTAFHLRQPFRFLREYEEYYNDHFPFRTRWVRWNSLLTYRLFRTSATADVVVGRQGWLFMGNINPYYDEVDYYRHLKPFAFRELRQWQRLLEERRDWLRRRGIAYLFVVAPNKSSIYPEFMPRALRPLNPRSRLDQLVEHMNAYSTLRVLDLRPALRAARGARLAYFKTDSHWNDWGGYAGYREIMGRLQRHFPQARPRPLQDFQVRRREIPGGDLALMLSLPDQFRDEEWQLLPRRPLRARVLFSGGPQARKGFPAHTVHACDGAPLPPALMVHDSFAHFLKQFLSEDFSRITYVMDWQLNFYERIIEQEGIRVVIDEMVEYSLLGRLPVNPGSLRR
jgi:hypothetical protein